MSDTRRTRATTIVLWGIAIAIGLVLSYQRYRDAIAGDTGIDLGTFLEASAHVREGGSVYDAPAYVYLPFIAWALLPFSSVAEAVGPWTIASLLACWGAVAAVTATLWGSLRPWQRPVVAGVGIFTSLYSTVISLEFWLGQNDTFILLTTALAVLFASLRQSALSGVVLGIGAALKTWPAGMGLWLLRRGAPHRWRSLIAAISTGLVAILVVVIVAGPQTLGEWIARTQDFSEQQLLAYSVWGVGRHLFADSGVVDPLVDAPLLGTVVAWALALAVCAALVVALLRPGTDSLAMWNVASALVLLLPVSHLWYRLLMLPLVWVWIAYAMRRPKDPWIVSAAVVSVVFWLSTFRLPALDNQDAGAPTQYIAIMVVAFLTLGVSVAAAALRGGAGALPADRRA
ncbi:glycosyltransferase family 87 protein [Microbacterium ulmi]|uniref:DUF2029 domain-containing protein n=1 Tax=Microbacterium ulmi TaxID=179095 RepID=A0A7Y2LYU5_9MICO|nr:glycosyltransferase family 87 protein [Microbacterium ulmi]NII69733.1 hypothetical protein [Microbacterium ulmi]NNH03292.1 DUF2029 domain-containing protein [Microbacterium ulmi]